MNFFWTKVREKIACEREDCAFMSVSLVRLIEAPLRMNLEPKCACAHRRLVTLTSDVLFTNSRDWLSVVLAAPHQYKWPVTFARVKAFWMLFAQVRPSLELPATYQL